MCRGLWLAAVVLRQEDLQEGHGFVLASYEGGHKSTRTMIFHLSKGPVHCTLINAEDKRTWLRTAALWEVPLKGRSMLGALCVLSLTFLQGRQVLFRLMLPTRGGKVQEPALHLISRTPDSQSSSCFIYSHECSLCRLGKVSQTFTLLFGFSFADNKKQWTVSLYNGLLPANWTVFPHRGKNQHLHPGWTKG